jgi:hypothetical protein
MGRRPVWETEQPAFKALAFGLWWLFYLQVAMSGPNRIILHRSAIHLHFIKVRLLLLSRVVKVLVFLPAGGQSGEEGITVINVMGILELTLECFDVYT